MHWVVRSLLVVGLLLGVSGVAMGQSNRLIETGDPLYGPIQNLQERGYLLSLNPSALPYTTGAVRQALQSVDRSTLRGAERRWYRELQSALPARPPNVDSLRVGGRATAGLRRSSSERLSVLEPVGDGERALPRLRLDGTLEAGNWIGQAGMTIDWFYKVDPDGLDTVNRLYGRSEQVYLGYNGDHVGAYLGRFDTHWALHDRQGSLLTDNPRAFDQLQFRLGGSTLSFRSVLGGLDNMTADSTFTGRAAGPEATRRFVFLHRLDWSPTPNLKLSAMEGELYSGRTASLSLRRLVPLHTLFFDSHSAPRNDRTNLILGGSVWYQPGPVTLHVQGMLDDILVSRREERKENGEFYPAIYTINSSVTWAGVTPRLDVGAELDIVSTNSYRTYDRAEEWSYAQRGLATNFSDYVRSEAHLTWTPSWGPGVEIEPALTMYWKGEGDFRRLKINYNTGPGDSFPSVLSGTVERTVRPSLTFRYQTLSVPVFGSESSARFRLWLDADMGVNLIQAHDHRANVDTRRFIGLFRVFGHLSF
ncbi:MAG: hypothetical protein R6T83_05090 [Salinibacter sp.]